jgi:hypothetical protein
MNDDTMTPIRAQAPESLGPRHVLLLFVDGLGLPSGRELEDSPLRFAPELCGLIREHAVPVDACLDVPGLPQSATGQTTILTGCNAAKHMGRHIEGFPGPPLRTLLEHRSLFRVLQSRAYSCTFANAYVLYPGADLPTHFRSATTVATLSAFGGTRNREELLAGEAVYHDLTRESLESRGVEGVPVIREAEAAVHLLNVARSVRFTLFEYFLTDQAGHRGTEADKERVLGSLDRFIKEFLRLWDADRDLFLLVSDHGNIEDPDSRRHTANPVPWLALGRGADNALRRVASIQDVHSAIVRALTA